MKQKMVFKVQMPCQKCQKKALQVAAKVHGVEFLGLEGESRDALVVIGDGVDAADMARSLRKKVGHADIVSLADVKPN